MDENENENYEFIEKLTDIKDWHYAYLWQSEWNYYFVKNFGWTYKLVYVEKIYEDVIADRMWDSFDSHDAWIEAVRNWDTDWGYEEWSNDISVWDYCNDYDYYKCDDDIVQALYDLCLWSNKYDSRDDWYYLDECSERVINVSILNNVYNEIDDEEKFNEKLWAELSDMYWINKIKFLDAEPIR